MSAREWKPGDVVAFRIEDGDYVGIDEVIALMDELSAWWPNRPHHQVGIQGGSAHIDFVARSLRRAQTGSLVVIDPESREQVERLIDLYLATPDHPFDADEYPQYLADMQAALREFANPTPPKPEEPTGLGAVVATDSDGDFIRVSLELSNPWLNVQSGGQYHYDSIAAVRVLSEGVQP